MSLYKHWFITSMLRDALNGGANSTSKVTFKRMVASNDLISDKDFPGLTNASMQTIKANQTALISSTTTKDDFVTITSVFNSFNVTEEYKMNTIYLVAEYNEREFLAAITSANDPYTMPAESKTEHAEYTIKAQIGISNTESVDLNMDPEAVATNEQLMAVDSKHDHLHAGQQVTLDQLEKSDKSNVKIVGNQQVDGTKTFLQRIIGSVSGTAGAAIKLLTARKINGVEFDGSKDIVIEAKPNNDTSLVHKSGNETVTGVKTFLLNIVGNLTGNADTSTKLQNARKIGGVLFDGTSDIALPGVNSTGTQNTSGNAASATQLQTPRKIGGVEFDGSKDISLPGVNASGNQSTTGNAATASKLQLVRKIGGVPFDGSSDIVLPGVNTSGNQSTSGNAGSASKLLTARMINGVPFDGTKDITVNAANDKQLIHTSGNETLDGSKTFLQRIIGSITGNAGTASKLLTARTINGVAFDGTKDINVNTELSDSLKIYYFGPNSSQEDLNDVAALRNMRSFTTKYEYFSSNKTLNNPTPGDMFYLITAKVSTTSALQRAIHLDDTGYGVIMMRRVTGLNATPNIGQWGKVSEWGTQWKSLVPYLTKEFVAGANEPMYLIVGGEVRIRGNVTPKETLKNENVGGGKIWNIFENLPFKFLRGQDAIKVGSSTAIYALFPRSERALEMQKYQRNGNWVDVPAGGYIGFSGHFDIEEA